MIFHDGNLEYEKISDMPEDSNSHRLQQNCQWFSMIGIWNVRESQTCQRIFINYLYSRNLGHRRILDILGDYHKLQTLDK